MPPRSPIPLPVVVREVPIELCQFLKFGGLTGTGGEAKQVISQGLVTLNGVVETQKRKKLLLGDQVSYDGKTIVVALAPAGGGPVS
ncbi:MAG TPA: RNA-binding S4 domain-containing protein [Lacunisphaera sp.]